MNKAAGRGPSQRQLRVGEEVRHALSAVLNRGDFSDPRLADVSITVSEVRMSPDLKVAQAFVTPLGGASMDQVVAALNHAAGYVRAQLAHEVTLKFTPRVAFRPDQSFETADRLNRLLHAPRVLRDLVHEPDQDGPAAADETDEPRG